MSIMIDSFKVVTGEVDNAIDILREVAQWCEDNQMDMWKSIYISFVLKGSIQELDYLG